MNKRIILTAFGQMLRGDPIVWPDVRIAYRLFMDKEFNPHHTPIPDHGRPKIGIFKFTGKYTLIGSETLAIFTLVDIV